GVVAVGGAEVVEHVGGRIEVHEVAGTDVAVERAGVRVEGVERRNVRRCGVGGVRAMVEGDAAFDRGPLGGCDADRVVSGRRAAFSEELGEGDLGAGLTADGGEQRRRGEIQRRCAWVHGLPSWRTDSRPRAARAVKTKSGPGSMKAGFNGAVA